MVKKWILASASPRRKELLAMVFDEFEIIVSNCKEKYSSENPENIVKELACLKGREVSYLAEAESVIVSADTLVCVDNEILGKPRDFNDAVNMLKKISGRKHSVYTGVCVIYKSALGVEEDVFSECTDIFVDELNEKEILSYINEEKPYDKAGSYAIQGTFAKHVSRIIGDYNNVVGFPVHAFYRLVKEKGYIE